MNKLRSYWATKEGVVVCTDEALERFNVKNADHVIQYSLPLSKFRKFEDRFSTQCDFSRKEDKSKSPPTCWIILDESNAIQWPKMVQLLKRGKKEIPKKWTEIGKQIENERNKICQINRQYELLCKHVFMYGETSHRECQRRHTLLPIDILSDESGFVNRELRFHLLKIISPTEYIVRPMKIRIDNKWKDINCSNDYITFNLQFLLHYSYEENFKVHDSIELGSLCVIRVRNVPQRGEIIEIHKKK